MRIKTAVLLGCILISILLSACSPTVQTVEVTRNVPQTVLVTQLVHVPITTTPRPTETLLPAPSTLAPTETPSPTQEIDWYQPDPKVMIVRFYTLLDLHLYEQAYDLLGSSNNYRKQDKTRAIENWQAVFKVVKVLQVVRYNDYLQQTGGMKLRFSDNWYMVTYYAEGNLAYPDGLQPPVYIRVGKEDGEWKIEESGNMAY